jgi:hypothetical protein
VAIAKFENTLALIGHTRIVGDDQDGRIQTLVKFVHQPQDLRSGSGVEVSGRFVGEEDWRVDRQGAGDRDALPFTTGKLVREMIHAMVELNHLDQLSGALFNFGTRPVTQMQRQRDIFEAVERRQEVEELKRLIRPALSEG